MIDSEKFDALLAPIVAKFKVKLRRDFSLYQNFSKYLDGDVWARDIFESVCMEIHKISGTAKTLGFEELSVSAFDVEKCIERILGLNSNRSEVRKLIPVFEKFLSNLTEALTWIPADEVTMTAPLTVATLEDRKCHVLVIDDDPFARDLVALSLTTTTKSCKISEAATGLSGIDFLKTERPDLIVLDVHLPDMSGFDVLKEIEDQPENRAIPVVMLTRDEDVHSYISGIAGGATEYIRKPISVGKLGLQLMYVLKYGSLHANLSTVRASGPKRLDTAKSNIIRGIREPIGLRCVR